MTPGPDLWMSSARAHAPTEAVRSEMFQYRHSVRPTFGGQRYLQHIHQAFACPKPGLGSHLGGAACTQGPKLGRLADALAEESLEVFNRFEQRTREKVGVVVDVQPTVGQVVGQIRTVEGNG